MEHEYSTIRESPARTHVSDTTHPDFSLADAPELIGFFSYSREDDDDSHGALSALRDAIQRELRGQLGRLRQQLRLWQDKEAIAPGRLWEKEIRAAVEQAVFFIPIITPTAVKSRHCQIEFDAFLERERQLGRSDLVFPLLYIRVPELEDEARWRNHPVLSVIGARQWVDWRPLRLRPIDDFRVRETVDQFCGKIVEALTAPTPTPSELERQRREAAETREREEAERRSQEEARAAQEAARRRHEEEEQAKRQENADRSSSAVAGQTERRHDPQPTLPRLV